MSAIDPKPIDKRLLAPLKDVRLPRQKKVLTEDRREEGLGEPLREIGSSSLAASTSSLSSSSSKKDLVEDGVEGLGVWLTEGTPRYERKRAELPEVLLEEGEMIGEGVSSLALG